MLKNYTNKLVSTINTFNKLKHSSTFYKNSYFNMSTPNPENNNSVTSEYKLLYVENIPRDWNEEDIKTRFQQIGNVEGVHIIRNPLGDPTGKIVVQYQKIENIVNAIEKFHNKCPDLKPLKMKFYRKFGDGKEKTKIMKNVLLIKNLHYEVTVDDIKLMLDGVAEPLHIALPRDEEGEVRGFAFVYFLNSEAAQNVFKFLHLRYVKDRQLYVSYTRKAYDISDFRTRKELGIKLEAKYEKEFLLNQLNTLQADESKMNKEKIEYLTRELMKYEIENCKTMSVVPITFNKV